MGIVGVESSVFQLQYWWNSEALALAQARKFQMANEEGATT